MSRGSGYRSRGGAVVAAALAAAVLTGCGDTGTASASDDAGSQADDEIADRDGKVCPNRLPQAEDDPGRGFGPTRPAAEAPALSAPDQAWVCRYDPVTGASGPDPEGRLVKWVRDGDARSVEASRLPALAAAVGELEPISAERGCRDDLGWRWMLVYSTDDDLTGVVVDDFGCDEVRLTDDPFDTPPGNATERGTVSGVLTGPPNLLVDIRSAYGR